METFDGWEFFRKFIPGGQTARVCVVRNRDASRERLRFLKEIAESMQILSPEGGGSPEIVEAAPAKLAEAIANYTNIDRAANLGVLKKFKIDGEGGEAEKAKQRSRREVEILNQEIHPNILKLLDKNLDECWMITEFHHNGSLSNHRDRCKGNVRAALEAFRPLVEAVAKLHEQKPAIVHRDIKPENIFVACDGQLILGDFGIVFYEDQEGKRPTNTFEKVGPRDWMPPWAHTGRRLEDVNPTFDVYMLGKVLWSMISGEMLLPREYWARETYNLEKLFPDNPDMSLANSILSHCVVEDEGKCLPSANDLLKVVDDAITILRRGGQVLQEGVIRPCRICGKGQYRPLDMERQSLFRSYQSSSQLVWVCNSCGHVAIFHRRAQS